MTIEQLAEQVQKDSWRGVRTRIGRTNGQPVLHIIDLEAEDPSRRARTIKHVGEWRCDPLHYLNKPPKRREARDA